MSDTKDLLKLENEYRNELPCYKVKPKITAIEKPVSLKRVAKFLASTNNDIVQANQVQSNEGQVNDKNVEMNIIITSM